MNSLGHKVSALDVRLVNVLRNKGVSLLGSSLRCSATDPLTGLFRLASFELFRPAVVAKPVAP